MRHEYGRSLGQITRELFPEIKGQSFAIDDEARSRYMQVQRAYIKGKLLMEGKKPTR
jgi:hypothetical protein